MSENREEQALKAYINLLKSKGASEEALQQREDFLLKLAFRHEEQLNENYRYRKAVENLLDQVDKSHWPFYLSVTREFFPFWSNDLKAIAALNAERAFDFELIHWQPADIKLKKIWNTLDKQQFELAETWPMKAYTHGLRQEGASLAIVETRIKLVKLLLVRLKDAPEKTPRIYRIAVDSTYPLFDLKETRRLFLAVAREFYYFWIGAPEASSYILIEDTNSFI
jgi:hypothetical protein